MGEVIDPLVVLTAALVVITGYYAWQTRRTVEEMQAARRGSEARVLRDKSEAAARRALDGVRDVQHGMRRRVPGVDRESLRALSHLLDAEAPLVEDAEVSERVAICGAIAATASWPDESIEREPVGSVDVARLRALAALDATRLVLEDYLRERSFDASHWQGLPSRGSAQAWLLSAHE